MKIALFDVTLVVALVSAVVHADDPIACLGAIFVAEVVAAHALIARRAR